MIKKGGKETLSDKIASVLNAAPSFDPEDEINEETKAKVVEINEDEEADEDEVLLSKFRKQNISLLEEVDNRYAGKKGSRKDLKSSDEEEDSEIEDEDDASEQIDSEDEDVENEASDEEEDSDDNDSTEDENDDSEEGEEIDFDEADDNFKHLSDTNVSKQLSKGLCVRNQLNMWENLLEMRIQLQKCLITSNKMPEHTTFKELKSDDDFMNKTNETKKIICGVMDKMLDLQKIVIKKYPESKNVLNKQVKSEEKCEDSDEEIESDTEKSSEEEKEEEIPRKKRKLNDYENEIIKIHNAYKPFRNSVIQKWNEKTRVIAAKSSANHSVLNQIEHNLNDRAKLIKRTQTKRSDYKIVGSASIEPTPESDSSRVAEEYNAEIFDDDDFYHQLLRELIEVKSADLTDPVQLGRQWIQLQNLRSKMKRKIDTRATKGRKIRYAVHTKLVNFMAPIDDHHWTEDAKNELCNSLFGKSQIIHNK